MRAVFFLYRLSPNRRSMRHCSAWRWGCWFSPSNLCASAAGTNSASESSASPTCCIGRCPNRIRWRRKTTIAILQAFGEQYQKLLGDWQAQKSDSMDYYGAWVHQIKTPTAARKDALTARDYLESSSTLSR
ncbi:MAG: hypothetical protein ACLUSL_09860 [Ruminococcus sp.]